MVVTGHLRANLFAKKECDYCKEKLERTCMIYFKRF